LEGTEGLVIDRCAVERVDGNGIMLSRYHRNATISNTVLRYIGGTAMAGWGWTDEITDDGVHGYDARGGDFPRYTQIRNNIAYDVGLWEKQASAWFQAKAAQTTLTQNLFFNGPRAGINFNDGLGGGSVIESNLLFNFCRESFDHGPFNSWDRNLYYVHQPDDNGSPSALPLYYSHTLRLLPYTHTRILLSYTHTLIRSYTLHPYTHTLMHHPL
jgi:hypothetical protein